MPHEKIPEEKRERNTLPGRFPEVWPGRETLSPKSSVFRVWFFGPFFIISGVILYPERGPNKSRKQIKTFPKDSQKLSGSFPEGKLLLRQRDGTRPLPRLVFVETGRGAAAPGLRGASRSENTCVMLLAGCLWLDGGDGLVRRKGVGAEGGKGG